MTSLVHLSDCHVSTFGDSFHFRRHRIVRSKKKFEPVEPLVEVWSERGWRILEEAKHLVLVDAENAMDALVRTPPREVVIAGGRLLVG